MEVLRFSLRFGESEHVWQNIPLAHTASPSGGRRLCFQCPIESELGNCRLPCRKLYLPPGGRCFGCRRCHDLTYTSVQKRDPRVERLRRDPDRLIAEFEKLLPRAKRGDVDFSLLLRIIRAARLAIDDIQKLLSHPPNIPERQDAIWGMLRQFGAVPEEH